MLRIRFFPNRYVMLLSCVIFLLFHSVRIEMLIKRSLTSSSCVRELKRNWYKTIIKSKILSHYIQQYVSIRMIRRIWYEHKKYIHSYEFIDKGARDGNGNLGGQARPVRAMWIDRKRGRDGMLVIMCMSKRETVGLVQWNVCLDDKYEVEAIFLEGFRRYHSLHAFFTPHSSFWEIYP